MTEDELHALTRGVNPFNRSDWSGHYVSLDGTDASDFSEDDVAEIIASGCHPDGSDWDGNVAAVLLLRDGRYVSYETFWGPTGDGFSYDAYGGNADIHFASDLATVGRLGLTDEGRRLCGWAADAFDKEINARIAADLHSLREELA